MTGTMLCIAAIEGMMKRVECVPDITTGEINGYAPLMKNGTMRFVTAEKARSQESRAAFLFPSNRPSRIYSNT
jgi:hypothetical protein